MTVTACREVDHGRRHLGRGCVDAGVDRRGERLIRAPRCRPDSGDVTVSSARRTASVLVGPSPARGKKVQCHDRDRFNRTGVACLPGFAIRWSPRADHSNLSVANEIPGAKRGANDRRHRAMLSHIQP
jgi:hypothetical protein